MSILLADTTLVLNTKVQVSTEGYSLNDLEWIEFINASPFACQVTTGGNTLLLPAWYDYPIPLHNRDGNILPGMALPFSVTPYLQTIPGFNAVDTLHTILYVRGEGPFNPLASPLGGLPTGMTASGTATNLVNTGNPAGTNIISATVTGDAQAAVAITNDGIVAIGDAAHAGSLSVVGPITATGNIKSDGTNNLIFDCSVKAGVLRANGVQEGFWDSNGFTFNNDLHFPAGVGVATNNDILMKGGNVKANTNLDLNLDITTAANKISLKNAGTLIADISSAGIDLLVGSFNPTITPVTANGSVSGTAQCYQWMQGTTKVTVIILNSWRSASAQNILLPTGYTKGCLIRTGGIGPSTDGGFKLLASGTPVNINVVTALAANGGTISAVTQMYQYSIGETIAGFDTAAIWSNTGAHSGFIILEGI